MAVWIVRPGGRLVRFRNRQVRHRCSRRKRGRPTVGNGPCYVINLARAQRRALNAHLRQELLEHETADLGSVVPLRRFRR
jgi:hypothetical protein